MAAQLEALQPELTARAADVTQSLLPHTSEINGLYTQLYPAGEHTGEAVIILTAGVPGAGKSSLVRTLEEADSYRRIDPDEFKRLSLTIAEREGFLDEWTSRTLADGRTIQPGELSTLVHRLSTDLADELERDCYRDQENFVREGTFSWNGLPDYYLDSLRTVGGYSGYQVMAVEIGKAAAIDQALDRWWLDRTQNLPTARYLSPNVIKGMYHSPDDRYSVSLTNAVHMLNRPESTRFDLARLTVLDRLDPDQPVTKTYDHTPDHALTVETIERDVAGDRRPTTDDLLKQARALNNQLRAGDLDDRAPTIDHDPTRQRPIDPPENHITP